VATNNKNFVVKNSITIGQGTASPYSLQETDGTENQLLMTDGDGSVTWQFLNIDSYDIDGGEF
jgi:hypothetical protein